MNLKPEARETQKTPRAGFVRSQASLFDGLTFLMIVSFSMALVFTYLNSYGNYEDASLRSAHTLNYMQAIMKSFYYIDLATLTNVTSEGATAGPYGDLTGNCSKLLRWRGTFSVAEMLKKDLADENHSGYTTPCFDDHFGYAEQCGSGAFAPGKLAMRCAMKEMMKPFSYAGYGYLVDLIADSPRATLGRLTCGNQRCDPWPRITNSMLPSQNQIGSPIVDCEDVADSLRALNKTPEVFAVSAPFRVLQNTGGVPKSRGFTMRFCTWKE